MKERTALNDVEDAADAATTTITTKNENRNRSTKQIDRHFSSTQNSSQHSINMHIEVSVALNFVISYLYNKLPRRRVNIFGEELEKALKDKFQGHWYPEKPFKGSAFRCLKTGDPTDAVLERAARESGVPISDILENLPNELSVWIDPGEVSYRIGEKGTIKILISESHDRHSEDTSSADREVTKTFNPEAQCFRPIDAVSSSLSALSLSPKTSPQNSPPTSAPSPANSANNYMKNRNGSPGTSSSNNSNGGGGNANGNGNGNGNSNGNGSSNGVGNSFLPRSHAPLTFTTASFAATKFGSTKLKTNSKRTNSRMSPTEFSNYIKQRAIQQQSHHSHNGHNAMTPIGPTTNGHLSSIGPVSPARSLSPNPLSVAIMNGGAGGGAATAATAAAAAVAATNTTNMSSRNMPNDSFFFSTSAGVTNSSNMNSSAMYSPPQYGRNNLFEPNNPYPSAVNTTNTIGSNSSFYSNGYGNIGNGTASKYSPYIDTSNYYGLPNGQQQQPSNAMNSLGAPSPHINGMTNGHHQTLESNLNTGNINLLVAN
ncbi:protein Tob2-like [Sitodiplosis mosellana]|uniref:protein Tob2-like n=1 Tax=Sitodiplosis mosellana TaxID=263140 RepID=UPI0024443570|nr:protein Tob2-like [Sitodiplosis mosellana]XP_055297963.1 protein Tob2-like [Sitodiplosis mosellana]XP_055297964.1 protein Tob2-like [Sitodiplosis mosellana]